jgi:DNA polymerase I-like protein with 3'-5' exonuclease and polymerase domains
MGAALKMRRRFPQIGLAHQVHDDLVYIVPDAMVTEVDQALAECMNEPPAWAAGLPLASEGGIGQSYGDAK